jgi:hypothetical protein
MLIDFHRCNKDIFAWTSAEMSGVSWEVAKHTINIKPGSRLIKQGMRRFNQEKR